MDFKIVWSQTARLDLREIVSFIAEDDPEIAEKFGLKIIDYAERASRFQKGGRTVPEFRDGKLREFIFHSYRVIYRVKEENKIIEIARVWHAARGTPKI
ncbi:MAG: type II toxin-antitoxin system RelE/ParE family toxin [Candidatus Scalindua rubra]|uniref:Plasmid stabilization system protein n=1 Tax=Candidatus Scalindua brodae TaxID=237368 RepID=A0A0B0EGA8_9BACT|nr:MAG: hypothetical protein SCABRO_02173 [Candidatus Scalindua brodae]MBZ0107368.1 type II toxin-antitoxin system RelE/ParE family toxin [Candidatus Scalindua rubra]TWU31435.1 Plasmid stabilization system protein [Candidatus Brocadiaceae bacterium S225]